MRVPRVFFIVACALPLAGCLISEERLITAKEAVYPLRDGADVESFTMDNSSNRWQHEHDNVLRRSGLGYMLRAEDGSTARFSLAMLTPTTWLIEIKDEDSDGYLYGVLAKGDQPNRYFAYDLSDLCKRLRGDGVLARYKMHTKGEDCVATSEDGLAAALGVYRLGDTGPTWAYVVH